MDLKAQPGLFQLQVLAVVALDAKLAELWLVAQVRSPGDDAVLRGASDLYFSIETGYLLQTCLANINGYIQDTYEGCA